LKNHLAELLAAYPALQLLTGDAIFAQRPLLDVKTNFSQQILPPK
jgi:hypothetical protein